MRLNPDANIPEFLKAVQSCRGEVCFATPEGDILNLKSVLSQFVFTAVISGKTQRLEGEITVQDTRDEALLRDYCI